MALSSEYFEYGVILLVIAGASYVQAISGFAFALIVMWVIISFNLIQVAYAAIIVTILALVNMATALSKGLGNIQWRKAGTSLAFSIPPIAIGLYLLDVMSGSHLGTLRIALGVSIIFSGIMLLKPPHQDAAESKWPSFALFGLLSGLVSGLFSTGGPPVVFQFYRQPGRCRLFVTACFCCFL